MKCPNLLNFQKHFADSFSKSPTVIPIVIYKKSFHSRNKGIQVKPQGKQNKSQTQTHIPRMHIQEGQILLKISCDLSIQKYKLSKLPVRTESESDLEDWWPFYPQVFVICLSASVNLLVLSLLTSLFNQSMLKLSWVCTKDDSKCSHKSFQQFNEKLLMVTWERLRHTHLEMYNFVVLRKFRHMGKTVQLNFQRIAT